MAGSGLAKPPEAAQVQAMSPQPAINLPPVVIWLGAAFLAVHAVRQVLSPDADFWLLLAFAFIPARYGEAAAFLPGGEAALFWTPVTYAFLHGGWLHLAVNLVWMASFGGALARRFGTVRFLLLALVAAAAGAGVHYLLHKGEETLVIGASGAISGMMAATVRFAFAPGGPLAGGRAEAAYRVPAEPLFRVFTRSRALGFILIWFALNLLFGLAGGLGPGLSGPIAWEAHVGGFLAGLLIFSALDPIEPEGRLAATGRRD
jgi:membrane associated rhomboid family serine protease